MKTIIKLFVYFTVIAGSFFFGNVLALKLDQLSTGSTSVATESITETHLKDDISKKEEIIILNHNYEGSLKDNDFKYITVHITITYSNERSKKVLAVSSIESNFRYNFRTKSAECLSTSRGNIANDEFYNLLVFARRANKTTDMGASVAETKFKFKGQSYDKKDYCISCDCQGNIDIS